MGTNFYLMSRNKKLMREHFAVETEYDIKDIEYAIVDEPYLGYEIHLNKLSWGWRPLFQRHKIVSRRKSLVNGYMISIQFFQIVGHVYKMYHVLNRRQKYIFHSAIENITKRKSW